MLSGSFEGESQLKHRLAAIAIFALLVFSMLPIVVLPAHASGITVNNTTIATTTSSPATATIAVAAIGDTIIVKVTTFDNTHVYTSLQVSSMTDIATDVFTSQISVGGVVNSGANCAATFCLEGEQWSAGAKASGSVVITVNWNHTPFSQADIEVMDVTGIAPTATATDSRVCSTGTCYNAQSPSAVADTPNGNAFSASSLEVAGIWTGRPFDTAFTPGTGYTDGGLVANAGGFSGATMYSIGTAPSPTHYTWLYICQSGCPNNINAYVDVGAVYGPAIGMYVTITNFDLVNYLVVQLKKFYLFNETVIGVNGAQVDLVKWKWADGPATAEVQYSNLTKTATVLQGNDIITLGSPTATSSIVSGQRRLQVIIPVRLSDSVLDTTNVSIQAYAKDSDGVTRGYLVVRTNYFNILNQGGSVSELISGTCTTQAGGSTFVGLCQDPGWMMHNTTWFQLQQYHAEFAINLNDNNGNPDVELFQDYGNSNTGAEHYTAKGDWKVDIGWFYYINGAWMKGFHMVIEMRKGNQGVQDQWTQLEVLFYNKATLIGNTTLGYNVLASWIEQKPRSQIRLWTDIWLSDINASSMHGMRVGAYYYAIHQSGFTFFGSWSPFLQNASSTISFEKNRDQNDKIISAQQIQYSKLYFNISRSHHPIGQANFELFTRDFNIEEFKTTKGTMAGINTPILVDARIPTLPVDGFLAPLYAAITNIGNFIWGALSAAFAVIWSQIGVRFPWFTAFWDGIGANITSFGTLFTSILQQLGGFLSFLVGIFSFVTWPIQIVVNTWNYLSNAFGSIFKGADIQNLTILFLVAVFGLSFFEAAVTGDWPWMIRFAKQTWGIVNAIMLWTYYFAKIIIDAVLAIIP